MRNRKQMIALVLLAAAPVQPVTQAQVAATVAALLGEDYRTGAPSAAPPISGAVKELR